MGRNNKDYKMKDKDLTLNKKRGKLNKSIAFTLAGMAAIGAGAMTIDNGKEAQAIIKGASHKATKNFNNSNVKIPMTSSDGLGVTTSRGLRGSIGSINTGKGVSNGTSHQGIPKSANTTTLTKNKTTGTANTGATNGTLKTAKTQSLTLKNDTQQQKSYNKTENLIVTTQGFYRK